MKRASYKHAIEHIALNDDPAELDPSNVFNQMTVVLVSEIFGVGSLEVADDVVAYRKNKGHKVNIRPTSEAQKRILKRFEEEKK